MNMELRRKVLSCFKQLHRARMVAFNGDEVALSAARLKINEEFGKNKHITNANSIEELVVFTKQIEEVLKKHVLQAVKKDSNIYKANIHKDTTMIENQEYSDMPENLIGPFKRRKKCGDAEKS